MTIGESPEATDLVLIEAVESAQSIGFVCHSETTPGYQVFKLMQEQQKRKPLERNVGTDSHQHHHSTEN